MVDRGCMDLYAGHFIVYRCHKGGNQFLAFAKSGQIATNLAEMCVGVTTNRDAPTVVDCDNSQKSQYWNYDVEVIICIRLQESPTKYSCAIQFALSAPKFFMKIY